MSTKQTTVAFKNTKTRTLRKAGQAGTGSKGAGEYGGSAAKYVMLVDGVPTAEITGERNYMARTTWEAYSLPSATQVGGKRLPTGDTLKETKAMLTARAEQTGMVEIAR